jgi:hypothetical protein
MRRHLPDETLMDVVDEVATPSARAHVAACAECGGRVEEAREGLALAGGAEVPEPSPLYWEAFRRQVGRRVEKEDRRSIWWRLMPIAAAVAALVAMVPVLRAPSPAAVGPTLPAWSALPPADQDPGLAVLQGFASTQGDLVSSHEGRGVTEYIATLSDEESRALADVLRDRLRGKL